MRGASLHIGVASIDPNHYGTRGRLVGALNDAARMSELAHHRGFIDQAILVGANATTARVIGAISAAASLLQAGDTFFLSYSGHGGQIPRIGRDDPDDLDEGWCLVDRLLLDDELNMLLSNFRPGVHVVVFVDCCHSGTPLRFTYRRHGWALRFGRRLLAAAVRRRRVKGLPSAEMQFAIRKHAAVYSALGVRLASLPRPAISAHVVQLSACQDDQTTLDGTPNSEFTRDILKVIRSSGGGCSINQLYKGVLSLARVRRPALVTDLGALDSQYEESNPLLQL